jgi:hypothetical protein
MTIKPGNVNDLKMIEEMRKKIKKRANRKKVDINEQEDYFEGLSSDVKKVVRYRSKTVE